MTTSKLALLACLASTLYMTGVIVLVQVVNYPLFARVDPGSFRRYHAEHVRLISSVVLVPMVVELVTSVVLVVRRPPGTGVCLAWLGLVAATVTWAATAGLSVPSHEKLAVGFDAVSHAALVRTNAVRAAAWLVHTMTLLVMTARAMC